MTCFTLATLLLLSPLAAAQQLVPGKVLEVKLLASDPVLAGHGPSRTFEYDVTFDGTLYVWASSMDFDPILRVTDADGVLLGEDDDSGGGTTAFVALGVKRNELPHITVAAADAGATGTLLLHASQLPASNDADLATQRTLVDDSNAAREAGDYDTARTKAAEAVASLLARPEAEHDESWLMLLESAGLSAWDAQDTHAANTAWRQVFDIRLATLPDDHPDLQKARQNFAGTIRVLGDLAGARVLYEKVLEVRSRTLPDDHPDLQAVRQRLAATIRMLGDRAGARALEEKVLEVRSRTLPDDHSDLQAARNNLAITLKELGDLEGSRVLDEKVLEVRTRTLPDHHPDLQGTRSNLAATLFMLGDLAGARALEEKALEVLARTLPDDHPQLQGARLSLASALFMLGDLAGARVLYEKVLEVRTRTLADDHADLQAARQGLAVSLYIDGDLVGARVVYEKVLEVYSRTLPGDHPELQKARWGLAMTIDALGDHAGAQVLGERVLEVFARTRPDDDSYLQMMRLNLAATMQKLGDFAGARALEEKALEIFSRTLPDDHPNLQNARQNLANTMCSFGDFAGARTLEEKVLEVRSGELPDDHPDLQAARANFAITLRRLGDLAGARALEEKVLEVCSRTLPDGHRLLQVARGNLVWTIASQCVRASRFSGSEGEDLAEMDRERARCADLIGALCRAQIRAAREAIVGSPGREAEERSANLARELATSMSFASGVGAFEPLRMLEAESFVLAETTRGAAIVSAEFTRRAPASPKYTELRDALRAASNELARITQAGTTSEEFAHARTRRESVERELVALARELSVGMQSTVELDGESLAARLADGEAAVGFRRFEKKQVHVVDELDSTGQPAVRVTVVESLCAFVMQNSKASATGAASSRLTLVDLGPIAPIEAAVDTWRAGLGAAPGRGVVVESSGEAQSLNPKGAALRRLVFDPLRTVLGDAKHVILALDDVLHLVPFDALPADDVGAQLLGDVLRIETRATLTELLATAMPLSGANELLGLGGAAFDLDAEGAASSTLLASSAAPDVEHETTAILRDGAWATGFTPLPGTLLEIEGVRALFASATDAESTYTVLRADRATKHALAEHAPRARWLHVATHGWYASESIRSWSDPEPIDKLSGLGMRMSGEVQVRGMCPMLLCGLALAGANVPEDAVGRAPGLVTADEISSWDLTNCELVVLSACDTNVGERRAGQGVASLQKALQMAGARSVITSLWKVPDEATKELMLDFYRRLWVEKKPKWQALWEAKSKLRNAKDAEGRALYSTRDWAAWVLTGEPD